MHRAIVVLPLPDSPTSATHAPDSTVKLTPPAATTSPWPVRWVGVQVLDAQERRLRAERRLVESQFDLGQHRRLPAQAAHDVTLVDRDELGHLPLRMRACAARSGERSAQPAGRSATPTATPGIPTSRRGSTWSGTLEIRPAEYGWRGAATIACVGPSSTMRPAYMTATRSAIDETTARSCET